MSEKSGYRNGQLIYPVSVVDHLKQSGGGSGSNLGPNTVGTEEIIDGSVNENDLSDDVKNGLHELENQENYANDGDINNIFDQNQTQEAGAGSGEVDGGGAELPDE